MKQYLIIPHLHINNANAASSPYTVGFPAMTAWLGMIHALERRIQKRDGLHEVQLPRMTVACHACDLQVFKDKENYYGSLIGTANPLKKSRKTGEFERPPFIEEARCHLEVSILAEVKGLRGDLLAECETAVREEFPRLKAAGGDLILQSDERKRWKIESVDEYNEKEIRRIRGKLMPGYVLIERRDLLAYEEDKDALDKLLETMQVQYNAQKDDAGKLTGWERKKVISDGWLVPIAVGFRDLSGKIKVKEQRSYEYEHHFVEPLVSVGEFVMPYRCPSLDNMMWEYSYSKEEGLYLCQNTVSREKAEEEK